MVRNNIVDFEGMMEEVQKYIKREENIELIRKAYECARVNHIGQFRKSGEGYIRCSYATSLKQLTEALERMTTFVRSL